MAKKENPRRQAIKSLKSLMREDIMGSLPSKLGDKMAVKVVSDSPEGLKEGLEKAEDVLENEDEEKGSLEELLKKGFSKRKKED